MINVIKFKQIFNCEIPLVEKLAQQIWHECYSDLLSLEQRLYMLNKFLSVQAISESLKNDYIYYYNHRYQWDLGKRTPAEYRIYLLEGGTPLLNKIIKTESTNVQSALL